MLAYLHSYSSPFIEIIVLEWSIPATVGSFLPCWHCNDPQRTFLGKLYKLLVFFRINFYVVSLFYMQNLRNDFSSEDRTKTKNKIIHVFKKFLKSLVLRKLLKINVIIVNERCESTFFHFQRMERYESTFFDFQALGTKTLNLSPRLLIFNRWG